MSRRISRARVGNFRSSSSGGRNLQALEFDLGTAAYKRGDYEGALGAFGRAMTTEDPGSAHEGGVQYW